MRRWVSVVWVCVLFAQAACSSDGAADAPASSVETTAAPTVTTVPTVSTIATTLGPRDPAEGEVVELSGSELADVVEWLAEDAPALTVEVVEIDGVEGLAVTSTATACDVASSVSSVLRWRGVVSLGQRSDGSRWVNTLNGLEVAVSHDHPGAVVVENEATLASGAVDECDLDSLGRELGPDDPFESMVEGSAILREIPAPEGASLEATIVPVFVDSDGDGSNDLISAWVSAVVTLPDEVLKCSVAELVEPYLQSLGWTQSSLETASLETNSVDGRGTLRLSRFVEPDDRVEVNWSMEPKANEYQLTYWAFSEDLPFGEFVLECSDEFFDAPAPDVAVDKASSLEQNLALFAELTLPVDWIESSVLADYGVALGESEPIGYSSAWQFQLDESDLCEEMDALLLMLEALDYEGNAGGNAARWQVLAWRDEAMVKINGSDGVVTVEVMGNGAVVGTNQRPADVENAQRLVC